MLTIDLSRVIVRAPVITRVSGVWRWQPVVTATNYHKIYESRERDQGAQCHSQNSKIEIVNRSMSVMSVYYDEGDIVIIS